MDLNKRFEVVAVGGEIYQEINRVAGAVVSQINEIALIDTMIKHRLLVTLLGAVIQDEQIRVKVHCCLEVFDEQNIPSIVVSKECGGLIFVSGNDFLFLQLVHIYKDMVWDYAKNISDIEWGKLAYKKRPKKYEPSTSV